MVSFSYCCSAGFVSIHRKSFLGIVFCSSCGGIRGRAYVPFLLSQRQTGPVSTPPVQLQDLSPLQFLFFHIFGRSSSTDLTQRASHYLAEVPLLRVLEKPFSDPRIISHGNWYLIFCVQCHNAHFVRSDNGFASSHHSV